jgi:hypothetical protein
MTALEKLTVLANQLAQEEPNPVVLPIPPTGRRYDGPWGYVCNDNGQGCGKAFPDRVSKNRHQQWCKYVTPRESERCMSTTRLMGGYEVFPILFTISLVYYILKNCVLRW